MQFPKKLQNPFKTSKELGVHVYSMTNSFKTHLLILNWMLFIILLVHVLVFGLSITSNFKIAVIDAGSSGSRVHLFKLDSNKQVEEIGQGLHSNPGISTVDDFKSYLKPFANFIITNAGVIPVYVLATAGMRLISDEEVKTRFDKIRTVMQSYNFKDIEIRIISGNEEGLYGFLSTMDLSKTPSNQLGFLDMGGASMQISFVEKKKSTMFVKMESGGLNVFSHSWLKYGINQAKIRHDSLLTTNSTICGVFDPCSLRSLSNHCIKPNINLPQCRNKLKTLIKMDDCVTLCHAGGSPIDIPKNLLWYGASNFHYAVYDTVKDNHINVESTRVSVESRCRSDMTFDCFGAMWTLEILDILGIKELNIPLKLKNQEITWTRGYAVHYFYQNH